MKYKFRNHNQYTINDEHFSKNFLKIKQNIISFKIKSRGTPLICVLNWLVSYAVRILIGAVGVESPLVSAERDALFSLCNDPVCVCMIHKAAVKSTPIKNAANAIPTTVPESKPST